MRIETDQKQTTGQSLFDKIRRIEAGDSRGRKMHATTTKWVQALEDSKTDLNAVQIFNWLAGVEVYAGHEPHSVVLYTPSLGGKHDKQVFSQWLPRMLPDLMRAERAAKITIDGLFGWQYPQEVKNA